MLRFLPPLSLPDELLTEGLDILEEAFASSSPDRSALAVPSDNQRADEHHGD